MRIPNRCPSCGSGLRVKELACPTCATRVEGTFDLCPACALPDDDRVLLDLFLLSRGNAKGVERALGISYPTVRARLEQLWLRLDALRQTAVSDAPSTRPAVEIIRDLREGRVDVPGAVALLRSRGRPGTLGPGTGKG